MDKLLLTLTLLAFSSGVLCNVPQNLTEGDPTTVPRWQREGIPRGDTLTKKPVLERDEIHNQFKCPFGSWRETGLTRGDSKTKIYSCLYNQFKGTSHRKNFKDTALECRLLVYLLFAVITQLYNTTSKLVKVCTVDGVRNDYGIVQGMGAYKLHQQLVTWNEARKICMDEGGQLAFINSDAEAKMLAAWLILTKTHGVWIGTHDMFEQGHWVTLNGETLEAAGYDRWLPGEPNNAGGTEHCGTFEQLNGMNDLTCSRPAPFFCKITLC